PALNVLVPGLVSTNAGTNPAPSITSAKPATFTATPAVSIGEFPNITSPNKATFTVGTAGSFTLTATGIPTPTLSLGGALPAGLTFDPSTGVISGTPSAGTVGGYSLMVAASNTLGVQVVPFTLTVQAAQASKLVFLSSPASGTAGQALSPSLIVAVEDAFGDVVTDDS